MEVSFSASRNQIAAIRKLKTSKIIVSIELSFLYTVSAGKKVEKVNAKGNWKHQQTKSRYDTKNGEEIAEKLVVATYHQTQVEKSPCEAITNNNGKS